MFHNMEQYSNIVIQVTLNAINKPGYREEFKPVDVQTTEVAVTRKPELYLPRGPHASTELVPAQPPARTFRAES